MPYFFKIIHSLTFVLSIICLQSTLAANETGYLMENKGQLKTNFSFNEKKIDYYFESDALKLFVTKGGLIFQLYKAGPEIKSNHSGKLTKKSTLLSSKFFASTYEMKLLNSKSNMSWEKYQESEWYNNYYSQVCPDGVVNVKGYQRILLKNIYANIDWEIIINENKVKYNFIVHPGGKPSEIRMSYNFADSLKIENNDLKVFTQLGEFKETSPYTFQPSGKVIKSNFILRENEVNFQISDFDETEDLIIDPGVMWSTYFGGSSDEYAKSVKTDSNNNVVICGYTNSLDGVFNGGFQLNMAGQFDNFISKYDVSGNLLWSTYFGGESLDQTLGSAIDRDNNIYLAFNTMSSTGISYNGFQNSLNSFSNLFLAKFNDSGIRIWSSYFGSGGEGLKGGVAIDKQNNVYLYGNSTSSGMGTAGTYQSVNLGSLNGLLAKFDSSGSRIWCTYFGFTDTRIEGVCFDKWDNVYFSGTTTSPSIAHNGFKDTLSGITDAFLSKFDSTGNRIWVSYYGGSENEIDNYCSADTNSNIYLFGHTDSPDQISYNGFKNVFNGSIGVYDAYIVKFDSSCSRQWATYFGGSETEGIMDGSITIENNFIICGISRSDSGIAYLGYKNVRENDDAFVAEFNSNGDRLWSSYFGGPAYDEAFACATDLLGNIYLAGATSSVTGIGINGEKDTISGSSDAFLTQFNCSISPFIPVISGEANPEIFNTYTYYIDTTGILDYYWEVVNGQITSGQGQDTISVLWNQPGISEIVVHAMYEQGCYVSSMLNPVVNSIHGIQFNGISVFPNPFDNSIRISGSTNFNITLKNILGQTLLNIENATILNTENISSGIFILEVVDGNNKKRSIYKMIKN